MENIVIYLRASFCTSSSLHIVKWHLSREIGHSMPRYLEFLIKARGFLKVVNYIWKSSSILLPKIVFCFDFCAYHIWEKICPLLIWDFSNVTKVEKRESKKSFLNPRLHFWGRGWEMFPRFLFLTKITEEISNQIWRHFFKDIGKQKNETECHFSGFFVECKIVISKFLN